MKNLLKADQVGVLDGTVITTDYQVLTDMSGLTLPEITIDKPVIIVAFLTLVAKATKGTGNVHIYIGGEVSDIQEVRIKIANSLDQITYTTHLLRKLNPGTYTIKAQWQALNGSILEAQQRQISYMIYEI